MSLLEEWRSMAYDFTKSETEIKFFWNKFYQEESHFYDKLLRIQEHPILDTVENFANKFNTDIITMIGFLDGINDSLKIPNNIQTITEKSIITLDYDVEKLYQNAVKADAKHIYTLAIWDIVLPDRNYLSSHSNENILPQSALNIAKCPTCSSTNLKKISTTSKLVNTAMFGLFGTKRNKTFHCNNCDYEW